MSDEEQKRAELKLKYENWIKKNKTRLLIFSIIYLIILILNFVFTEKSLVKVFLFLLKIHLLLTLFFFISLLDFTVTFTLFVFLSYL